MTLFRKPRSRVKRFTRVIRSAAFPTLADQRWVTSTLRAYYQARTSRPVEVRAIVR